MNLETFRHQSQTQAASSKNFLAKLKRENPRAVDEAFHEAHEEVFAETDCLACANCCKTTSPIFYQTDVARASEALRIKPGQFVETYLRVDEDRDMVLKSAPCPFLMDDNRCRIYEARPKACREYPHTDRKKMIQILDLTYKNTMVCPAVLKMVERVKSRFS